MKYLNHFIFFSVSFSMKSSNCAINDAKKEFKNTSLVSYCFEDEHPLLEEEKTNDSVSNKANDITHEDSCYDFFTPKKHIFIPDKSTVFQFVMLPKMNHRSY